MSDGLIATLKAVQAANEEKSKMAAVTYSSSEDDVEDDEDGAALPRISNATLIASLKSVQAANEAKSSMAVAMHSSSEDEHDDDDVSLQSPSTGLKLQLAMLGSSVGNGGPGTGIVKLNFSALQRDVIDDDIIDGHTAFDQNLSPKDAITRAEMSSPMSSPTATPCVTSPTATTTATSTNIVSCVTTSPSGAALMAAAPTSSSPSARGDTAMASGHCTLTSTTAGADLPPPPPSTASAVGRIAVHSGKVSLPSADSFATATPSMATSAGGSITRARAQSSPLSMLAKRPAAAAGAELRELLAALAPLREISTPTAATASAAVKGAAAMSDTITDLARRCFAPSADEQKPLPKLHPRPNAPQHVTTQLSARASQRASRLSTLGEWRQHMRWCARRRVPKHRPS